MSRIFLWIINHFTKNNLTLLHIPRSKRNAYLICQLEDENEIKRNFELCKGHDNAKSFFLLTIVPII